MERMVEILAPAGDFDTLKAAVAAGADAIYLGGERFGARAFAKNFTEAELCQAIDYAHLHNRKIYLTVNTLVKEREFETVYTYLAPYYEQGLDAVIVQDIGVMDYIRRQFPGLSIHSSTQMTVTNAVSAAFLEQQGVERVVPARELSLLEIKEIRDVTNLEIECFVHGALCYSYSGQCLMSSLIGGRSGNRGQCAQPCRLSYSAEGKRPTDILSLKDLCTLREIPNLIEHGIDSFKIEGRMKQPAYVATVVEMYRRYRDLYLEKGKERYQVKREDLERLQQAYQRRGYCNGYYYVHNGKEMLSLERPKAKEQMEYIQDDKCQEKIAGELRVFCGEPMELTVTCGEAKVTVSGALVQEAEKSPMSRERLEKQLQKTGNTPFAFERIDIQMGESVFVPIQALNELRRQALELLEAQITNVYHREMPERLKPRKSQAEESVVQDRCLVLTASAETVEQLQALAESGKVACIYVEDTLWTTENQQRICDWIDCARAKGTKVYFAMARIYRTEAKRFYQNHLGELMAHFDGALVRNLESLLIVKQAQEEYPVVTDSTLYVWNRTAKEWLSERTPGRMTAPVELNSWELEELDIQGMELPVYGYLPVMTTAGCVKKNTSGCDHTPDQIELTDRQKKKIIVKNICRYCYNVIYNTSPLMLLDQQQKITRLSPEALRLQFTLEDGKQTKEMVNAFYDAFIERRDASIAQKDYTRGHFRRGVK